MRPLPLRKPMRLQDAGWCLRANRLCERNPVRRFFAVVSRLGDGVFWYALMAAMVVFGTDPAVALISILMK